MQIWKQDINARGGPLGWPVKLVFYDDQSNPSTVPGIYTKLLDVDEVDIVVSGYATNMVAPAKPVVKQNDRTFFALLGLAVNTEFKYPRYFSIAPTGGPRPKEAFSQGCFAVAMDRPKAIRLILTGSAAIRRSQLVLRDRLDGAAQEAARQEYLQADHHRRRDQEGNQQAQGQVEQTQTKAGPDIPGFHQPIIHAEQQDQANLGNEEQAEEK